MADNTPIPTESVPMKVVTPPAPVTPPPEVKPVTQQAVEPPKPALEIKQAAETVNALNELFDNVEAPKPIAPSSQAAPGEPIKETPKPVDQPPAGTPIGSEIDKTLEGIKAGPGAHPNVQKGIDTLKEMVKTEAQKAEALQTKVKEYEAKFAEIEKQAKESKLPENVEKELKQLRDFQREVDFKGSKEFKEKFIDPLQKADSTIMGLLKQAGVKDEVLKFLNENGGIIALSQSSENAGIKDKPDMTMAEYVEHFLLARTPTVFKNRILATLTGAQDTIEKGRAELEDWQKNGPVRHEAKMKALTEEFNAGADAARAAIGDLASRKTVPADATAEVRQEIEAHNQLVEAGEQRYAELLKVSNQPKTAGEIIVKAVQADMLMKMREKDQATIKELRDRIGRLTASGSHSTAGQHAPPPGQELPTNAGLLKQTTEQAMEGHFKNISVTP